MVTSSEHTAQLQRAMSRACRSENGDANGADILSLFNELQAQHEYLGWLSLWSISTEPDGLMATRALAYLAARSTTAPPQTVAILLLLSSWRGTDLSISVTMLTAIERAVEEPESDAAKIAACRAGGFIAHLSDHRERMVLAGVVDTLVELDAGGWLPIVFSAATATRVASRLSRAQFVEHDPRRRQLQSVRAKLHMLPAVAQDDVALQALRNLNDILAKTNLAHDPQALTAWRVLVQREYDKTARKGGGAMATSKRLALIAESAAPTNQYSKQLERVRAQGQQVDCIDDAVKGVMSGLRSAPAGSLVVYGEPQSGKTEMMICLTARLLDAGHRVVVHLMNDSVDLLVQSLERFKLAGLAPAPRSAADLAQSAHVAGHPEVLFCKKNKRDLEKLIQALGDTTVFVVDDEADYATPNSKINQQEKTKINELVEQLIGERGTYVGVTATPARLNLNNTFNTATETWVRFRPHAAYTGADVFFPPDYTPTTGAVDYRLNLLEGSGSEDDAREALVRFMVTVAHLNTKRAQTKEPEGNYSFLMHTSGKTDDHRVDRATVEQPFVTLMTQSGPEYSELLRQLYATAEVLYPDDDPEDILRYVVANASRRSFVVLNSQRDRQAAGDQPAKPTCPFTVIIGGNIVSRGVTFPDLLAMFFTRTTMTMIQQDTYIQRARMFGARQDYLEHFELTIPKELYWDWHRCFVFHRLALEAIQKNKVSPVWLGDERISIAANSSIDRATVDVDRGEMSFAQFDLADAADLDNVVAKGPKSVNTLKLLRREIGDAIPAFLVKFLEASQTRTPGTLAVHACGSIEGYGASADIANISRKKGFLGKPQLEPHRFPDAVHHVKILHNGAGRARVFYKNTSGMRFVQNLGA